MIVRQIKQKIKIKQNLLLKQNKNIFTFYIQFFYFMRPLAMIIRTIIDTFANYVCFVCFKLPHKQVSELGRWSQNKGITDISRINYVDKQINKHKIQ